MVSVKGFLTDEEVANLVQRYLEHIAPKGATEEELEALVKWANDQRLGAVVVEMILDGEVVVTAIKDGEPLLRAA
jgi:hypothetical protein